MLLLFVDILIIKIGEQFLIVFIWLSCILEDIDIRYTQTPCDAVDVELQLC